MLKKLKNMNFVVNYRRIWPFVRPFWLRAILSLLITIPIGSLDAVIALSLKPFMDTVVIEQNGATPWNLPLYVIPILIIGFTVMQAILEYAAAYLNTWVGGKITQEMQRKLYKKLMQMDQSFFDMHTSGELAQRFSADPGIACSGLLANLKTFTTRLFSSITLVGVCFTLRGNWPLSPLWF